jgi:TolA-binding protein
MISEDADDDPEDAPALVALTALGRDAAKACSAAELDEGLHMVHARLADAQANRRRLRRLALLGGTAAACVLAALKISSVAHERALPPEPPVVVARIEGGVELEGGYLSQSGGAGVKVLFSEGSTFALTPGTRGRLRSVASDGAHFAIEHGTAALEITQSRGHRWSVEAGPFLVTVKGTAFTVSWDPASERFELRLRHGRVVVNGPVVNGGVSLEAGQRLVVSLPRAETVITGEQPEDATGPHEGSPRPAPTAAIASDTSSRPPTTTAPAAASPAKRARTRRWAADLASGHWDRILADVDRDGVDATLEDAGSEDLFALADAARYRRRADLARAALLAHRRRFPHATRSLDALFLLGRAEELREHGSEAQAIAWYDDYLAQAPRGAYAAEALGRKMILTNQVGGPAGARSIAREYLLRFPTGSYAGAARALQRDP